MELNVLITSLLDLVFGGDRPELLGVLVLGVTLGFLGHLYWTARRNKRKTKHLCHPSEHDKLLEYMYDGCPLDPKVYSGQKIDTPDNGHGHAPHAGLQLSDKELDMANRMLTLAVQSYHCPKGKEGYRTRNIAGLPCVTVFDEDLLNKLFSGVIKVRLHCANNLRPVGLLRGYARPYVEGFVAASSFRTETATHGSRSAPTWDEDHWLYIRDPKYDSLSVRVLGDTAFAKGINLGAAVLGLSGLVENEGREIHFKLPLRGFAAENSTITLTCGFYRFPVPGCEQQGEGLLQKLKKYQTRDKGTPSDNAVPITQMGIRVPVGSAGGGLAAQQHQQHQQQHKDEMLPMAYVDCGSTETQAWVFANTAERKVVVAFRGTEPRLADIITDARFIPCTFETIIQDTGTNDDSVSRRQRVRVHRGFMSAYRSVRRTLSSILYAITGPDQGDECAWDIHVTGHSLGGALATLGAYELGIYKDYAGNICCVTLHTYGSPRVGDKQFAAEFDKMVPNAWRFTNGADVVPTVPPASVFNYQHVGHPVRLRGKGKVLRGLNGWEEEAERKRLLTAAGDGRTGRPHSSETLSDEVQRDFSMLASILRRGVTYHYGHCYGSNLPKASAAALQQQQA